MKSGNEKVFRHEAFSVQGYEVTYYPDDQSLEIKQHTAPKDNRHVCLSRKGLLFLKDIFKEMKI